MDMKFGEIEANQILSNEFQIRKLRGIVDWIIVNGRLKQKPQESDIKNIEQAVLGEMKKKYPKSGFTPEE